MTKPTGEPQVGPMLDPRFRRRRIEVRRQEGRRRLVVVASLVAVVGSAVVASAGLRSALLDVETVRVTGAERTPPAEVVAASGVRRGQPLVDVDPEAAATAVGRLPWVLRATVTRSWSGSVAIALTERAPAAVTRVGEQSWALIDVEGQVLASVRERTAGLPAVTGSSPVGPPGSRLGPGWAAVLRVASAAPRPLLGRVSAVAEAEGGGVELRLTSDGVVRFGPAEQVDEKFTAIVTVFAQVDTKDLAVLDVRNPRAPVLTRRGVDAKVSTRAAG